MPIVDIICCSSGHDAPDETYGHVAGQVGRDHRTEGIYHRVCIHFSVEKPEEGNVQKGRPIPRQGKSRPFPQSEFSKMFQILVGMGADELAPEVFFGLDFGVDYGGGGRWFRFDSQHLSTLVAKFCVLIILLVALCAEFHL